MRSKLLEDAITLFVVVNPVGLVPLFIAVGAARRSRGHRRPPARDAVHRRPRGPMAAVLLTDSDTFTLAEQAAIAAVIGVLAFTYVILLGVETMQRSIGPRARSAQTGARPRARRRRRGDDAPGAARFAPGGLIR